MQNSIGNLSVTEFLRRGALLRWGDELHLVAFSENTQNLLETPLYRIWAPCFFDLSVGKPKLRAWKRVKLGSPEAMDFEKYLQSCVEGEPTRAWGFADFDGYKQSFFAVKNRIETGDISKAVPFTTKSSQSTLSLSEKAQLILNSLKTPSSLFAFGFWNETEGILGATPETLFYRDGQVVKTMALAGTQNKNEGYNPEEFLTSSKMREEHQLVIDDIVAQLRPLGDVKIEATKVVEYPHLAHLKTEISLHLQAQFSSEELVKRLHPTPALGVMPRTEMPWFQTLPGQKERRHYGAPLLFSWENEAVALVCIRSIEWNAEKCWVTAGGGVVFESTLEGEWKEIETKFSTIWKTLKL